MRRLIAMTAMTILLSVAACEDGTEIAGINPDEVSPSKRPTASPDITGGIGGGDPTAPVDSSPALPTSSPTPPPWKPPTGFLIAIDVSQIIPNPSMLTFSSGAAEGCLISEPAVPVDPSLPFNLIPFDTFGRVASNDIVPLAKRPRAIAYRESLLDGSGLGWYLVDDTQLTWLDHDGNFLRNTLGFAPATGRVVLAGTGPGTADRQVTNGLTRVSEQLSSGNPSGLETLTRPQGAAGEPVAAAFTRTGLWVLYADTLSFYSSFEADPVITVKPGGIGTLVDLKVDTAGKPWVMGSTGLAQLDDSGQTAQGWPRPLQGDRLFLDPAGNPVIVTLASGTVQRLDRAGEPYVPPGSKDAATLSLGEAATDAGIDQSGRVWLIVGSRQAIVKTR
jgi:hypothetical protein